VSGVTLGNHIYYVMDSKNVSERLRKHEMVHVEQYQKYGFIRFLYLYFKEYLSYRLKGFSHYQAYYEISFEKDARLKETLNG
jgi:hypothetical protein